jgi:hypothetical protein
MEPMPVQHVSKEPFDVYFVDVPSASPCAADKAVYEQLKGIERQYCKCLFRCVEIGRHRTILSNYIDVEPADAAIFATEYLDKALEYGEWPKLLLILRPDSMSRSFRSVPNTTSPRELAMIQLEYPTVVDQRDGTLHFSRLKQDNKRLASTYEEAYGWYVSGDPKEALAALVICCRPEDLPVARHYLLNAESKETAE